MSTVSFAHLILLEPLGLLYGSSGRLLTPEALTGRACEHFPPDSPAVAGLLASQLPRSEVRELTTAGPFWLDPDQGLMLPTPMTLLQERGSSSQRCSSRRLAWLVGEGEQAPSGWRPADGQKPPRKAPSGGWISLSDWPRVHANGESIPIHDNPWREVPHLHSKLQDDQRISAGEGALFLEYGIALKSGIALAYLSSHAIAPGVYRFGGEGHLVQLRCAPIPEALLNLLAQPLSRPFALITPGLWGSPKLSLREPIISEGGRGVHPWHRDGQAPGILTDKPRPWRYRLGAGNNGRRRLSRGRWAMPAGSCYQLYGHSLEPWQRWDERWFPREGFSFKQLGTALALPLHGPP